MDLNSKEPLKQLVRAWADARDRALMARATEAWTSALDGQAPDEAFLAQLARACAGTGSGPVSTDDELGAALDLLEAAQSQAELLKQLLEALQPFVERSALFVLKQGAASLFASRGFEADAPRSGATAPACTELEALVSGHLPAVQRPGEASRALGSVLGRFQAPDLRILPLHLRRRPVALLLVDSGARQRLDHPNHVRALVRAAELRLALLALSREEERTAGGTTTSPTQRLAEAVGEAPAALEPKLRANAERSARVLVDDLLLYFPRKVEAGRRQGSLYDALREELDRSRTAFVDRYGALAEEGHHIFRDAVIAQLCEGDSARLGPAPWA